MRLIYSKIILLPILNWTNQLDIVLRKLNCVQFRDFVKKKKIPCCDDPFLIYNRKTGQKTQGKTSYQHSSCRTCMHDILITLNKDYSNSLPCKSVTYVTV